MERMKFGNLKYVRNLVICLLIAIFSSCENQDSILKIPDSDNGKCRLLLDVTMNDFESGGSRAESYKWAEGSKIYFHLLDTVGNDISACAIYDGILDEWEISYKSIFPSGIYTGTSVFFDGEIRDESDGISFGPDVAIYRDVNVKCEKTSQWVKVVTTLIPMEGKVRFKNQKSCEFTISGIVHNHRMSLPDMIFQTVETPIRCTIGDEGFSGYIYGEMPITSRELSIGYDNMRYRTVFNDRILSAGKSGVIQLPTYDSHQGWEMIVLSTPVLGELDVYNITVSDITCSSSIISSGNGIVSDCGFCYSKSSNPTINDAKISIGVSSDGLLGKTITGLQENTTYYVRAYAINESGAAYSDEVKVTTLAITIPEVSVPTVRIDDGSDSAEFTAQIMSDGRGTVSNCGFCYSATPMPDLSDTKLECSVAPTFTANVSSLEVGKRYYVRAYAINQKGIAYGAQISFIAGGGKPTDDDIKRPNMIKRK